MGESVTEGTVVEWRKQEGDPVAEGETIADVTTDKVDVEIPSPAAGTLRRIVVPAGGTAEVGAVLAELAVGGGADGAARPEDGNGAAAPVAQAEAPRPAAPRASAAAVEVTLPAMGESVTEGTVARWVKQPGDAVSEG